MNYEIRMINEYGYEHQHHASTLHGFLAVCFNQRMERGAHFTELVHIWRHWDIVTEFVSTSAFGAAHCAHRAGALIRFGFVVDGGTEGHIYTIERGQSFA